MSNSLAIAAVTATLRKILVDGLQGDIINQDHVTVKAPDKARGVETHDQVNLFLYQTVPNSAFTNSNMPGQTQPGESSIPPLALDLFYLITVWAENDDDTRSHRLLGKAMSVLHDHPVLGRDEIKNALAGNDLHDQPEKVRITPRSLSLDEMSKLWTTFQTNFRISATYQASVVLIESQRAAKTPLPVLTRGEQDSGIASQPDLIPAFPTIESIGIPDSQPSAEPGTQITLSGHHLAGDQILVRLASQRLADPQIGVPSGFREIAPLPGSTDDKVEFLFPSQSTSWPAGIYGVSVVVKRAGEPDRITSELGLALAPVIENVQPNPATRSGANVQATVMVTCKPHVITVQDARLLLGDREVKANPHNVKTNTLSFTIKNAPLGEHFVRLRIDGTDSQLIDRSKSPPEFKSQKLTIQDP